MTAADLDVPTLLSTAQAISTAVRLPDLLTTVMQFALENAGADRGALMLEEDGQWVIEAIGYADTVPNIVTQSQPLEGSWEVSEPIIRLVAHTHETVVVHDALNDSRFSHDPHVREARPHSILCMPLMSQSQLRSIIYLENTQTTGAFTKDRIAVLSWLSGQMASAIDKARLHQSLEANVAERTRELQAEIAMRQQVEEALRRQERLFRTLVEHSPDMISRFDRDFRPLFASAAAQHIAGRAPDELVGKTYADLGYPQRLYAVWEGMLAQVFESGQPVSYETELPTPERRVPVHMRLAPEFASDGSVESVVAITSDITELKDVEQGLRHAKESAEAARIEAEGAKREEEARRHEAERRRQVAESLRGVLAILNSDRELEKVLDYIGQQANRLLGSRTTIIYRVPTTRVGVRLLSASGIALRPVVESYVPVRLDTARRIPSKPSMVAIPDITVASAVPLAEEDEKTGSAAFVIPVAAPFRAVLAAPILMRGEVFGGLALYYRDPHEFSDEELELASMLSDQVALATENAHLREQVEQVAAASERNRLARELHDAVTQAMFSAGLIADALPRLWDQDPVEAWRGLDELRQLTRGALAEMRTLLVELRPTGLTEKRLGDLLRQLAEAVSNRTRVPITVDVHEDDGAMLPAVQIAFYRIAQEALNNIAKHARAQHVQMEVRHQRGQIVMRVQDDGVGFDSRRQAASHARASTGGDADGARAVEGWSVSSSGHLGLAIMRERATSVGAAFSLRSRPGKGTALVVRWPGNVGRLTDE